MMMMFGVGLLHLVVHAACDWPPQDNTSAAMAGQARIGVIAPASPPPVADNKMFLQPVAKKTKAAANAAASVPLSVDSSLADDAEAVTLIPVVMAATSSPPSLAANDSDASRQWGWTEFQSEEEIDRVPYDIVVTRICFSHVAATEGATTLYSIIFPYHKRVKFTDYDGKATLVDNFDIGYDHDETISSIGQLRLQTNKWWTKEVETMPQVPKGHTHGKLKFNDIDQTWSTDYYHPDDSKNRLDVQGVNIKALSSKAKKKFFYSKRAHERHYAA